MSETLMSDDVPRSLADLLTGKFEVSADELRPDASFDDLGLDSLAVVELFVELQELWQITLEEGRAVLSLTVADTERLVREQVAAAPDRP